MAIKGAKETTISIFGWKNFEAHPTYLTSVHRSENIQPLSAMSMKKSCLKYYHPLMPNARRKAHAMQ